MPQIENIYAFLINDPTDLDPEAEGIPAELVPNAGPSGSPIWAPMIGNVDRIETWRPKAQALAAQSGRTVRLVRFTGREDVEVVVGGSPLPGEGIEIGFVNMGGNGVHADTSTPDRKARWEKIMRETPPAPGEGPAPAPAPGAPTPTEALGVFLEVAQKIHSLQERAMTFMRGVVAARYKGMTFTAKERDDALQNVTDERADLIASKAVLLERAGTHSGLCATEALYVLPAVLQLIAVSEEFIEALKAATPKES